MRDYEELFGPATRVTSVVDEPLQECFLEKGYVFAHETATVLMAPLREPRVAAASMEDLAA
jgi:hypothetical protein